MTYQLIFYLELFLKIGSMLKRLELLGFGDFCWIITTMCVQFEIGFLSLITKRYGVYPYCYSGTLTKSCDGPSQLNACGLWFLEAKALCQEELVDRLATFPFPADVQIYVRLFIGVAVTNASWKSTIKESSTDIARLIWP